MKKKEAAGQCPPEQGPCLPVQMRGISRKKILIDVAREVFLAKGYGGTSLDDIIVQAGGSRRNIYDWFGNKEALFGAVVEECCASIVNTISEFDIGTKDPAKALVAIGCVFVETLLRPEVLALSRVVIAEAGRFPELGRAFYQAGPERIYDRLAADLRAWTAEGKLNVADPDTTARILIEMMKSDLHLRALYEPDQIPTKDEISYRVRLAVHMVLNNIATGK